MNPMLDVFLRWAQDSGYSVSRSSDGSFFWASTANAWLSWQDAWKAGRRDRDGYDVGEIIEALR